MTINLPGPITVFELMQNLEALDPEAEVRVYVGGSLTRHLSIDEYPLGDSCGRLGCEHGHPFIVIDGDHPSVTQERDA